MTPARRCLALAVLLGAPICPPSAGRDEPSAANPPDLRFEVRFGGGESTFVQGELIPLELVYSSSTPERYELDAATYDRSGRLHSERFEIEPERGAVDPLRDYFSSGLFTMGGIRSVPVLTAEPEVLRIYLNEWLRFDRPGDYHLVVTSNRVTDLEAESVNENGTHSSTLVPLRAEVDFTILPQDPGWADRELSRALKGLQATDPEVASQSCARLRHLGSEGAVDALVRLLPGGGSDPCRYEAMLGLFGHPDRPLVVRRLEEHLVGAGAVDGRFLDTLARLKWHSDHPVPQEETDEERSARLQAQTEGIDRLRQYYLRQLAAAVDHKTGTARATSLALLAQNGENGPRTEDSVRARLAERFQDLDPESQVRMLEYGWDRIRGPAMIPVLRRIAEDPPAVPWHGGTQPRDLAVRRLFELDPEGARKVVLQDIARGVPQLSWEVLGLLPDVRLPAELEASVVDRLAGADPYDGLDELAFVVARYGSERLRARIEALVRSPRFRELPTCWRPPFLAYFLRVDPAGGAARVREALAAPEPGQYSACLAERLTRTAEVYWSAELEAVAAEALDSDNSVVRRAAAEVLRKHGGPEAEAPIWHRLERWSASWQSRLAELARPSRKEDPYGEERRFEWELVRALLEGPGWVLEREDLERLAGLCVDPNTCQQIAYRQQWLGADDGVPITVFSLEPLQVRIAGHYEAETPEELERRLVQFSPGTVFVWSSGREEDMGANTLRSRIESFLAEHGMGLREMTRD